MAKNHERISSGDERKLILIADDEMINRELLGGMLKDDYDIVYACDGSETIEKIREFSDTLSLVLLDILMPVMSGLDVLREIKEDENLSSIPVIVTTAEKQTELESLELGAIDFIPKPYPSAGVIKARLRRIVELSEDRDIIKSTERDPLTGLYNREYFYRYTKQFDTHHSDVSMDAAIVDINHFHILNERYGKSYGDEVLKKLAEQLQSMVHESGGIVSRRLADTFIFYCPHREDYEEFIEKASDCLADSDITENKVRLRMGVYSDVDKSIDIEQRLDRAKMAADTVRGNFVRPVGYYDKTLHDQQLYAEQLIEDFSQAVSENQFKVYYQPKFDIRPATPVLSSAEALVRWEHPNLGMISPGVFIPLFEENGLIQRLDTYVWEETARQSREWKDVLGYSVPVSVNVSRIDMYDLELADTLQGILKRNDLTGDDFLLEVTESAYTQDSGQIIDTVENLRSLGFRIEMDDFGTGYSSLNMISNLPVDALKLDMQFIRDAFREGGNAHVLEMIIGIADYLDVPVIAEGVETEDQLHALKVLGCDLVQGYFFSKPVPAYEFEAFILQKKEADIGAADEADESEEAAAEKEVNEAVRKNAEIPEETTEREETRTRSGIQLKTASVFFVVLALIAAIALFIADQSVSKGYQRMKDASDRYISAQLAAADLESGSDYLTDRVRCFVVTGEIEYLNDFIEEVEVTKRRDEAVENLERLLQGNDSSALESLNNALNLSNELISYENLAMRLMIEAGTYDMTLVPENIKDIDLSEDYQNMTPSQMRAKAQELVFDNNYMHYKDKIRENVRLCTEALIRSSSQELENASAKLSLLVRIQSFMTILFLIITLSLVVMITLMIRKPLTHMVSNMQNQETLEPEGVEELRFVAETYNKILKDNNEVRERLSHQASHDALTGLFNRGAYDLWMKSADTKHIALILLDVDHFKEINDNYGHAVGDRVLQRVAEIIRSSFRSVDILCRIGGDEFAVVMTRVNSSMRQLVKNKINRANELLSHPKDDLPPVSLSVGVAFSDREDPEGDIFKDADTALYRVKQRGRNGCEIY